MNKKISVVLATFNESQNIEHIISDLYRIIPAPLEIIVVDDNSPDGTADIVDNLDYPDLKLIRRVKKGLASAFYEGIIKSSGDIICWMDADGTMPVETLKTMISHLDCYDIAIGSRYVRGGGDERSFLRVLASRFINGMASFILKGDVKDYDSGFIAVNKSVFDRIVYKPYGYGEYFIEFVFDACRKNLKIVEVGFIFKERSQGKSKSMISIFSFLKLGLHYMIRILKIKIFYILK